MADDTDIPKTSNVIRQWLCSAICGIAVLFDRRTYYRTKLPRAHIGTAHGLSAGTPRNRFINWQQRPLQRSAKCDGHHLFALDREESSLVLFTRCR
jgi:hypothetical protein